MGQVVALRFQHHQIQPRRGGAGERHFPVDIEQPPAITGHVENGGFHLFIQRDCFAKCRRGGPLRIPDPMRRSAENEADEKGEKKKRRLAHGTSFP
ncbi:hypothetical protein SDC9_127679 [bioreactor metagenome]|uniref:Uncharacterized protein n=1 Tax=bioreactor metagenome TaxID=1076179 RepID=A0A645CUR8_9ZZZZ